MLYLILLMFGGIFVSFHLFVNSSKIYTFVFFIILVDLWIFVFLSKLSLYFQIISLFMPAITLTILFILVDLNIKKESILTYIISVVTGHSYSPITLQSFSLLWKPFKNYLNTGLNLSPPYIWPQFPLAIIILVFSILKELIKKYLILILLFLFSQNSLFMFFIYFSHIVLFITLVSLLPMDPKVVKFISPFFGHYVLAWLGSYQTLNLEKEKLEFFHPLEYVIFKNKDEKDGLEEFTKALKKYNNKVISQLIIIVKTYKKLK